MALHVICLHISRHLAQISFDIRQYACTQFVQSDKKSDFASDAQSLCGIALSVPRYYKAEMFNKQTIYLLVSLCFSMQSTSDIWITPETDALEIQTNTSHLP